MTGRECDLCDRASGDDANVCTRCASEAAAALRSIPAWLDEALQDAVGRQASRGTQNKGKPTRSCEAPLPIDPRASEAASVLRNTLVGWVRIVAQASRTALPDDTVADMARWLVPAVPWARSQPWAGEFVDEVQAAVRQAVRAVDIPIRTVPLPQACRVIELEGQTPRPCGGRLVAILAPGLSIDGQVRCEASREHASTVAEQGKAKARTERVKRHLLRA